jgi:hypothetical protein
MKVADLQARLTKLGPTLDLMIALHGDFVPVVDVTSASGACYAVIRGRGKPQRSPRFSIQEDGIIGQLVSMGMSDEDIAVVLGRPAAGVKRRKKHLTLNP